jgi:hypothetical protein
MKKVLIGLVGIGALVALGFGLRGNESQGPEAAMKEEAAGEAENEELENEAAELEAELEAGESEGEAELEQIELEE